MCSEAGFFLEALFFDNYRDGSSVLWTLGTKGLMAHAFHVNNRNSSSSLLFIQEI